MCLITKPDTYTKTKINTIKTKKYTDSISFSYTIEKEMKTPIITFINVYGIVDTHFHTSGYPLFVLFSMTLFKCSACPSGSETSRSSKFIVFTPTRFPSGSIVWVSLLPDF